MAQRTASAQTQRTASDQTQRTAPARRGGEDNKRPGKRGGPDGNGAQSHDAKAEPVWLVRIVLVLFFIAFAVFLAREVRQVVEAGWRAWF